MTMINPGQLSRRHFLGSLGAGFGSLVLRPRCLFAADRALGEMDFIVVSDTHLGRQDTEAAQKIWTKTAAERTAAAVARSLFLLLCAHVPVHTNLNPDRGWYVKPENGQTEFYQIIKKHESRVLALFHGHFHNGLRGWDDHALVHEVVFPSALYNQ